LKRFDDAVEVGRFSRHGNQETVVSVNPIRCQINNLIALNCRQHVVDNQIALL
jgi:hypothetical protein